MLDKYGLCIAFTRSFTYICTSQRALSLLLRYRLVLLRVNVWQAS